MLGGDPGQGDAGVDAELFERVAEVPADGMGGNVEPFGDFAVGEAVGDQPDHGELGLGQGRPAHGGPALSGQAALDPELPEAPADPGQVPAGPAGGVDDQGAVEGGDSLVAAASPDLGHGQIFEGGGQREPPLAGFQDGDGLGQQAGAPGEQATGVDGAGQEDRYRGVDLGSPFGAGRRRLGQLPVPAGQGDADQLRVVGRVEGEQREQGQALLLAQRRQPPAGLGRVAAGLGLQGQQPGGVPLDTRAPRTSA